MNSLPVEINQSLFQVTDWNLLQSVAMEMEQADQHRHIYHTETEAWISVLNKIWHPTNGDKWWQATREQLVQRDQVIEESFAYRRNEVRIEILKKKLSQIFCSNRALTQIALDECLYRKRQLQQTSADRVRAIVMWSKIKSELYDGTFSIIDADEHQLVSYTTQFCLRGSQIDKMKLNDGEFNNLAGQLQSGLELCKKRGVLDKVYANLPTKIVEDIQQIISITMKD